jgi:hypothetical protein
VSSRLRSCCGSSFAFVLRDNLLASSLTVAFALLFNGTATLLQNHRSDLTANAIMEIVFAIALAVWIVAFPNQRYAIAQSTISCAE